MFASPPQFHPTNFPFHEEAGPHNKSNDTTTAYERALQKHQATLGSASLHSYSPNTRTVDPITTGTSVLAVKCKDFVMISADTCVSYGSLSRFRSTPRIKKLGDFSLIGASGEYSDFQFMMQQLNELIVADKLNDDGKILHPKEIHSYLTRVMYNKRNRMDPYYNQVILGGFRNGQSFLGLVDLVGTSYEDQTLATGYGAYIARPLLRKAHKFEMDQADAKKLLEDCMRVLFYRDARSINKIQIAVASSSGLEISEPYSLQTFWEQGANLGTGDSG